MKWGQNTFVQMKDQKSNQEKIADLYKTMHRGTVDRVIYLMLASIFAFISSISLMMPYQMVMEVWPKDTSLISMGGIFSVAAAWIYMQLFSQYKDQDRMIRIRKITKYLPVSEKEFLLFRIKKLVLFSGKITLALLVLQIVIAGFAYHQIEFGNIWFPIVFAFVLPVGLISPALVV